LVSGATSESDAKRLFSMEKNVTWLSDTRFAIGTMEAQLMAQSARFYRAVAVHDDHKDADFRDGNQSSDRESSNIGGDLNRPDPRQAQHEQQENDKKTCFTILGDYPKTYFNIPPNLEHFSARANIRSRQGTHSRSEQSGSNHSKVKPFSTFIGSIT
jgi:hypothetical protein